MPCRGGPSIVDQLKGDVVSAAETTERNKGFITSLGGIGSATPHKSPFASQREADEAKSALNRTTSLLCEVCQAIEDKADLAYFENNAELKHWWENHKELDRLRKLKEQEEFDEALEACLEIRNRLKHYLKYILDENIDEDDRKHFEKKVAQLKNELGAFYVREGLEAATDAALKNGDRKMERKTSPILKGSPRPVD